MNKYLFWFTTYKNYYKVLGLNSGASIDQIKSAYFMLAKKYHPDHNPSQASKFKEINEAYSILSDIKIKKDYDTIRSGGNQQKYQQQQWDNQWNNQQWNSQWHNQS